MSLAPRGYTWKSGDPCPYCGKKHEYTGGHNQALDRIKNPTDFLGEREAPCKGGPVRLVPYGRKWENGRYAK